MSKIIDFNNYLGKELQISQKSFWKREFFLMNDNVTIGKLQSVKMINDLFVCDIEGKEFEFYKKNLFGRQILIREKGKQLPFASFNSNFFFTSGELKLPRGKKIFIKIGTFKNKASLYESETKLLLQIKCKLAFNQKCILTIENRSEILEEYSWLPLFVFYLLKVSKDTGTVFH